MSKEAMHTLVRREVGTMLFVLAGLLLVLAL